MTDDATYDFRVEGAPKRWLSAATPVLRNLLRAAEDHPGVECHIATYTVRHTAEAIANQLRTGKRFKTRPQGTWVFRSGAEENGAGFGIWATFTPPAPTTEPDSQ